MYVKNSNGVIVHETDSEQRDDEEKTI